MSRPVTGKACGREEGRSRLPPAKHLAMRLRDPPHPVPEDLSLLRFPCPSVYQLSCHHRSGVCSRCEADPRLLVKAPRCITFLCCCAGDRSVPGRPSSPAHPVKRFHRVGNFFSILAIVSVREAARFGSMMPMIAAAFLLFIFISILAAVYSSAADSLDEASSALIVS